MPAYLSPGVYREDISSPPPRSLLTGVPAFIGFAAGPVTAGSGRPAVLTRWEEFELLGGPVTGGDLTRAVRGFFDNGGQVCVVLWVDSSGGALPAVRAGLAALEDSSDVDLLCLPDLIGAAVWETGADLQPIVAAQRAVLDHCAARGDRFAILDAVPSPAASVVLRQRDLLTGPSAGYGALYHPRVRVPAAGGNAAGPGDLAPPCGHVAGVFASTDRQTGFHRAPAGLALNGVFDLETALSGDDAARLGEAGVNPLRAFPGRGIKVWGARTLSTDPSARDITVRRVMGTIARWLELFMTGLVHEPADIRLRVRIMREVTAYLEDLYREGVLSGRSAQDAFYVKCDDETNPPQLAGQGIVVTEIGVAPAIPAEFIVVRIVNSSGGVTVSPA